MIEILESPKYLVALKLSESLTAIDVEKAYKATEDALKSNDRISFYAEVDESMNLTFDGIVKDLVKGVGHLGNLGHYYRAAVVTNKRWVGALARVEGLVFASIDVRVFPRGENEKALAWASEIPGAPPKPETPRPSVHVIATTSENVFAYEVNGKLREADIKSSVTQLRPYLEREGKINVLARLSDFRGFDLMALFDDDLAKLKYKALSKVERYAVVGPKPWMRNFLELLAPLFSTQIRVFEISEEDQAWDWVGAKRSVSSGA